MANNIAKLKSMALVVQHNHNKYGHVNGHAKKIIANVGTTNVYLYMYATI